MKFQDNLHVYGDIEREMCFFNQEGEKRRNAFDYWLQYLDMIHLLFDFIEWERN